MASQGQNVFRDADWSESNELIVATEHVGFVRDLLGPRIVQVSENRRLGLTRLRISTRGAVKDLRHAIKATPGARQVREALVRQASAITPVVAIQPIEDDRIAMVATDLRALAAAQHGGWMPTIGRNRTVHFPGSGALSTTSKTSYGVGATSKTSYGVSATSKTSYGVKATSKTSYGGGGVPQPLSTKKWTPPHDRSTGPGRGVRVGVVDTRIWPHPWLAGGWAARPSDVLPKGAAPGEIAGHGTFVAGLILSQAPGATIAVRVGLNDEGQGTAWDAAEAIVDLGQSGVSVINLSFSCFTGDGQAPLALARAIDRVNSDIVVVAAAGNHAALGAGEDPKSSELARFAALPSWPAALDDVVAVGALDRHGKTADFSPVRPWVDVAARGVDLRSTYPPRVAAGSYAMSFGDGWAQWSGTSFSTALVSGAIAAGIDPGRLSAPEVVDDLLSTAQAGVGMNARQLLGAPRSLDLRIGCWARGRTS